MEKRSVQHAVFQLFSKEQKSLWLYHSEFSSLSSRYRHPISISFLFIPPLSLTVPSSATHIFIPFPIYFFPSFPIPSFSSFPVSLYSCYSLLFSRLSHRYPFSQSTFPNHFDLFSFHEMFITSKLPHIHSFLIVSRLFLILTTKNLRGAFNIGQIVFNDSVRYSYQTF